MCGIVGYVGYQGANDVLLDGLRRLEYRGYDSAGTAVLTSSNEVCVTKSVGRIRELESIIDHCPSDAKIGIGHTRWATHGAANQVNAHPHCDPSQRVAICHNGVIENYYHLREKLISEGVEFQSETDTEVIAVMIGKLLDENFPQSNGSNQDIQPAELANIVKQVTSQLQGTYGLVALFRDHPDLIIASRLGSPIVIGVGDNENFVASDASALAGKTDRIIYLADHQVAVITSRNLEITHRDTGRIHPDIHDFEMDENEVGLNGFDHFMLKEIFEQSDAVRNTMRGRINETEATAVFGGLNLSLQQLRKTKRIILSACGTSWHSALVGEYMIEEIARIPVEVEYASELRYRNPPLDDDTIVFSITQSGETADTLAALREIKRKGIPSLAICNVVGSSIAQESDGGIYLHAGPEIGVASTKAYTCQCTALAMLAIHLGRIRDCSYDRGRILIEQLQALPSAIERALESNQQIQTIADKYKTCNNFLYLGRQANFPTALEGALKLKEISYIHAEGYPAAEMKHGPIALVDRHTPSVFVMPQGFIYDKVLANLEEIKARGGPVIAVAHENDRQIEKLADDVIRIPEVDDFIQPMVAAIPLQLLAYHVAVLRGCDVDKPRNLAKSVTVE